MKQIKVNNCYSMFKLFSQIACKSKFVSKYQNLLTKNFHPQYKTTGFNLVWFYMITYGFYTFYIFNAFMKQISWKNLLEMFNYYRSQPMELIVGYATTEQVDLYCPRLLRDIIMAKSGWKSHLQRLFFLYIWFHTLGTESLKSLI